MKINIFYSWQSDNPQNTNREFIEEAIRLAIEQITTDKEITIEAVLDRDTQNTPGSPAITDTILQKIDRCGIFLSDVTLVSPKNAPRPTPNPNVLIELGYAVAKVGWDRIICVMNEEYGGPSKLPFDLQGRRWPIRYRLSANDDAAKKENEKDRLEQNIELAVRTVLSSGILAISANPKDRRVAVQLARALVTLRSTLGAFLSEHSSNSVSVFLESHLDKSGTQYPSPELVEPIVKIIEHAGFALPSNIQIGETRLTWAQAFVHELVTASDQCDVILDRYADRDEQLIAIVEEIGQRAHTLAFLINTSLTRPELAGLYDNGMYPQHVEFFRYFLLAMLKAYRILKEFGGE
ncbi:MAG: TIR domain-containing protein [Chloroflexota bacterium]